VIVAAILSVFFILKRRNTESNGGIKTAEVQRGNIIVIVTATGTLTPLNSVQVGSQVSGTIAELRADFNSRVKKGQIIAVLDTTFLAASERDAEASLERARAQARQAEIDLERAKSLAQKQVVSQLELETATVNHENAVAGLKSAEAQLERARINLKYATIRAPVDGIVVSRNVDVGQTVAASLSAPTLFVIANDLKKMQLEANIDEADIGMIRVGQRTTFTVNAYPEDVFEGTVSQVRLEPVTVQDVVNYVIIVSVSNPEEKLMPGMTATLGVQVDERDNVLKVPNMALRFKPPEKLAKAASALEGGQGANQQGNQPAGSSQGSQGAGSRRAGAQSGAQGGTGGQGGGQGQGRTEAGPGTGAAGGAVGGQAGAAFGTPTGLAREAQSEPTKVIWKVSKEGKLIPVEVKIGVSDGAFTQVSSPQLAQGDAVAVGYLNPKLNQTQEGGGRRGGMFFGGPH